MYKTRNIKTILAAARKQLVCCSLSPYVACAFCN